MEKAQILQRLIDHLDGELERYASSARAAHEEATHEQSRAENKYDTRGLEASYLAHGQSRQAMETWEARRQFAQMRPREFAAGDGIDLGALVKLAFGPREEEAVYFVGPSAGGTEVTCDGATVMVITPESPLGRLLKGRTAGERVTLEGRRGLATRYTIRSVK